MTSTLDMNLICFLPIVAIFIVLLRGAFVSRRYGNRLGWKIRSAADLPVVQEGIESNMQATAFVLFGMVPVAVGMLVYCGQAGWLDRPSWQVLGPCSIGLFLTATVFNLIFEGRFKAMPCANPELKLIYDFWLKQWGQFRVRLDWPTPEDREAARAAERQETLEPPAPPLPRWKRNASRVFGIVFFLVFFEALACFFYFLSIYEGSRPEPTETHTAVLKNRGNIVYVMPRQQQTYQALLLFMMGGIPTVIVSAFILQLGFGIPLGPDPGRPRAKDSEADPRDSKA